MLYSAETINRKPMVLGLALGDPKSPKTYSGVPYHLFEQFSQLGCLAGVANSYDIKLTDVFTGRFDFVRSLRALRPKRNALWRYRKRGMEILSKRLRRIQEKAPSHDVVFQIGVGGIPTDNVNLVSHVEM